MRNVQKDEIEMAQRREAMLEQGFRLFAEHGIEAVSMLEVAKACHLGIATLYRYYNTKLALVIAIGTQQWERFGEKVRGIQKRLHTDRMSAAEELRHYLDCYIDLYRNHKDLLRFNQNLNNYVQHENATPEQMKPYLDAIGIYAKMFHGLYEKGKADGTIRTELSEARMFAATSHIMIAVGVRYAQGLVFSDDSEADRTEEYQLLRDMILDRFVTR